MAMRRQNWRLTSQIPPLLLIEIYAIAEMDPELATGLLSQARLAITDSYRGPDGEALFGPPVEAPSGAGPADQLAAFLGRRV